MTGGIVGANQAIASQGCGRNAWSCQRCWLLDPHAEQKPPFCECLDCKYVRRSAERYTVPLTSTVLALLRPDLPTLSSSRYCRFPAVHTSCERAERCLSYKHASMHVSTGCNQTTLLSLQDISGACQRARATWATACTQQPINLPRPGALPPSTRLPRAFAAPPTPGLERTAKGHQAGRSAPAAGAACKAVSMAKQMSASGRVQYK